MVKMRSNGLLFITLKKVVQTFEAVNENKNENENEMKATE